MIRRKLVACVTTDEFRRMVQDGELRASSWLPSYRVVGNTIPVLYKTATVGVFGRGDRIFLCSTPKGRRA